MLVFKQLLLKNAQPLKLLPDKLKVLMALNAMKLGVDVSVNQDIHLLNQEPQNVQKFLLEFLNGASRLEDV